MAAVGSAVAASVGGEVFSAAGGWVGVAAGTPQAERNKVKRRRIEIDLFISGSVFHIVRV
jgi:hypothetical protein